jgi:hypothetical protein
MEDLERYLDDIVEPTIKDFEQNPTSVRHAFLACVATLHAVDYLAYPRKSAEVRKQFGRESSDFRLVDDVTQAFKHVVAGNRQKPRLIANDVISRPPALGDQVYWDLSRWDDHVGGVTLDRDRKIDLLEVVKHAAAFLREKTKAPMPDSALKPRDRRRSK